MDQEGSPNRNLKARKRKLLSVLGKKFLLKSSPRDFRKSRDFNTKKVSLLLDIITQLFLDVKISVKHETYPSKYTNKTSSCLAATLAQELSSLGDCY